MQRRDRRRSASSVLFFDHCENHCGLLFFERLALKYSKINEAKPNNPIIEMIMIPNSELSMAISG
jgi:hypothetical protein